MIKNIPDLTIEKNDAITIGGSPNPVESLDHNTFLGSYLDSVVPRLQQIVADDLADDEIDFQAAGSRGAILFPLIDDSFILDSIVNPVKGDTIYLVISNDFDFTIGPSFTSANSQKIGQYRKSATVPSIVELLCVNDNASNPYFIFKFLNNKTLNLLENLEQDCKDAITFTETVETDFSLIGGTGSEELILSKSITATEDTKFSVLFKFTSSSSGTGSRSFNFYIKCGITTSTTLPEYAFINADIATNLVDVMMQSPEIFVKSGETMEINLFVILTAGSGSVTSTSFSSRVFELTEIQV